jgi:hypothetical protein
MTKPPRPQRTSLVSQLSKALQAVEALLRQPPAASLQLPRPSIEFLLDLPSSSCDLRVTIPATRPESRCPISGCCCQAQKAGGKGHPRGGKGHPRGDKTTLSSYTRLIYFLLIRDRLKCKGSSRIDSLVSNMTISCIRLCKATPLSPLRWRPAAAQTHGTLLRTIFHR